MVRIFEYVWTTIMVVCLTIAIYQDTIFAYKLQQQGLYFETSIMVILAYLMVALLAGCIVWLVLMWRGDL